MSDIEVYKPGKYISFPGAVISLFCGIALAAAAGIIYGFSYQVWKFLGIIMFYFLGIISGGVVYLAVFPGKVRNSIFMGFLAITCFFCCLLIGNFILFRFIISNMTGPLSLQSVLMIAQEYRPPFYTIFLVLNSISSIAFALGFAPMFDDKNKCWYKSKFIGYLANVEFSRLRMILRKEYSPEMLEKNDLKPALLDETRRIPENFTEVKYKISAKGERVYLQANQQKNFAAKEGSETKNIEGFINREMAIILEKKIKEAMSHDKAFRNPDWEKTYCLS